MTEQTAQGGVARRGRKVLWWVAGVALVAAVLGWIGVGAALWMDAERAVKLGAVVFAALATEATVWATAAALGLTVFEARKRIWAKITGRG